ncbi:MAG: PorT family protein [Prevotella sp.]|nr:PorT family protein [Prevotella sp.]
MKKILMLVVMATIMVQANAQIVSSRSSMVTRHVMTKKTKSYNGWKTLGIEYISGRFSDDLYYIRNGNSFIGGAVNYTQAISITRSAPLFLELGFGGQFSYAESDGALKYVSVKIPVNLIYDIQIPNTNVCLAPYVGLNFRGNVWGYFSGYNIFSDGIPDYEYRYDKWTRFQIAAQAGVKARFNNKFFIGIGYGLDFNEIVENTKVNELSISAGIVF